MSEEFELKEIDRNTDSDPQKAFAEAQDAASQMHWAWTAAAIPSILASVLILFPRLLLLASDVEGQRGGSQLTPLESFLGLHFGLHLLAVSVSLLLNIPSGSPITRPDDSSPIHPLLGPLSISNCLSAFVSYNTKNVGPLSTLVTLGSGAIGLWGLWEMAFAGTGRISRKTGADKHTSAFLFKNKNAASVQKKKWKQEHGSGL